MIRLWRRPLVRALAVCGLVFAAALPRPGRSGSNGDGDRAARAVPAGGRGAAARPGGAGPVPAGLRPGARRCCWRSPLDRVVRRTARRPGAGAAAGPGRWPPRCCRWSRRRSGPCRSGRCRTFVAAGEWRGVRAAGADPGAGAAGDRGGRSAGMFWSARTGLAFAAPGGYFIGPRRPADPAARWGAPDRPTSRAAAPGAPSGQVPPVGDAERRQAVEDLRHWRAAVRGAGRPAPGDPVRADGGRAARAGPGRVRRLGLGRPRRWSAEPAGRGRRPRPAARLSGGSTSGRTSQSQTSSTRCAGPSRRSSAPAARPRADGRRAPPPRPASSAGPRPPAGGSPR